MSLQENQISDVDQSIHRNNYKLTADKIIQILDTVREEASKSRRRWVWELMQNAKDVKNKFGHVDIEFELSTEELKFAHNGDPFSIDNITGLIQQVSSKLSDSKDLNITGKFGTGFITTHLLSDVIMVNGIVARAENKFRRFSIELDRSGTTSEELLPSIENALEEIRGIDSGNKFPIVENYDSVRKVENLDSEFIYPLKDEPSRNAAQIGLNDLIFTLPVTLINIEKIGKVRIINKIENTDTEYFCEKVETDGCLNRYEIKVKTNEQINSVKNYFVWVWEDIKLICEVDNWQQLTLLDNFKQQPFLYRDFPLVGTENFHFPFILNGKSFYPTEKRDGILINGNTTKPEHNRKILDRAISASIDFTDALVKRGCKNLYVLANTQLPNLEMEPETEKWYLENQKKWRSELLLKPLIESNDGNHILGESLIPEIEQVGTERGVFWDLVGIFYGTKTIPKIELNAKWYETIRSGLPSEYETWGKSLILTKSELLRQVEAKENIGTLATQLQEVDPFKWLNKAYSYLSELNQLELLNSFRIVPNQHGNFNYLKVLFKENADFPIPDPILDVLLNLDQDWRKEMIHRSVEFAKLQHVERGISKASEEINLQLKKETKPNGFVTWDFLNHAKAKDILFSLLKLTTKESRATSFRSKLFEYCKVIYHLNDELIEVGNLEGFNFEIPNRLTIRLVNNTISDSKNIESLADIFGKDNDYCIDWLDSYLRFLSASAEYKYLIEFGNIIPNRYYMFCAYNSLNNYGTNEQPLDEELIDILKELNSLEDWNKLLVADGIGISVKNTKTFEELGNVITVQVGNISQQDSYETYRKPLLTLIDWCQKNSRLAKHYLTDFDGKKTRTFFILTMEKSTIGSEMMQLLKNQDKFKLLIDISNSSVSINDLQELVSITSRIGKIGEIIEFAKNLEEEDADFNYKLKIGKSIEDTFSAALMAEGLNATVKYHGTGSHDFEISNPQNGKSFYVEIKSFPATNLIPPIRMSISQVQLATTQKENFALCVIERPHQYIAADVQHIKSNLKLVKNYEAQFESALNDYQSFALIAQASGDIGLEFFDTQCKVRIGHAFINSNHVDFGELILQIKNQLVLS